MTEAIVSMDGACNMGLQINRWCGVVVLMAILGADKELTADTRPNVLVILTDDHGYGDVSAYGATDVRTPHIDQLAEGGMKFLNMRSNATVCSPARAALMTGMYPDRVGVPGVIRTEARDSWGYLNPTAPTLASELQRLGYHTAIIGKWHLGLESPNLPNERGFDFFHGFLGDMMDSYTDHKRHGVNYLRRNLDPIEPNGHATDLFTEWACDYVRSRVGSASSPFFLYLAYNAPHFPIEPPQEWKDRVRDRGLSPLRQNNLAFVEHLDAGIGKVLAVLSETGLDQNTMVVFTSDNGGSLPHGQSNAPWRDGKQSHYDGGLRVPFMVRWPGVVRQQSIHTYHGLTFDLFPTIIEAAGGRASANLDGVSLLPILRGEEILRERELYFVRREGGPIYCGKSYEALIRWPWKLMQNHPFAPLELYNLEQDPQEQMNLIEAEPAVAGELRAALQRQIQRAGDTPWQPPVRNAE